MASSKKHNKNGNFGITLNTGNEVIEPDETEMLLGSIISNDLNGINIVKEAQNQL